jgi:hypothetical protein
LTQPNNNTTYLVIAGSMMAERKLISSIGTYNLDSKHLDLGFEMFVEIMPYQSGLSD